MLIPEQVKPLLLHENEGLRDLAADYFGRIFSPDPTILHALLQAYRQYGSKHASLLTYGGDVAIDQRGLEEAMALLRHAHAPAQAYLNYIVSMAPVELQQANERAIRNLRHVFPEALEMLDERLEMARQDDNALWRKLEELAGADEETMDFELADSVTDLLANRPGIEDARLLQLLEDLDHRGVLDYMEVFVLDIAGKRRLPAAIPAFIERIGDGWDYLSARAAEALGRVADVAAVPLLRERMSKATTERKIELASAFSRIPHPDSESAALELLKSARNPMLRVELAHSLCDLFSQSAFDQALQIARREEGELLRKPVLALGELFGIDVPEAETWRGQMRQTLSLFKDETDADADPEAAAYWEKQWLALREQAESSEPPAPAEPLQPFRRTEPKVGRNDPCPCGSGKKYKKCCGR